MKKLLILLIFIGVLIMLKPVSAIIKDSIGNIVYRGNVVTGIVATDNGDGSYDCYISESEVAYPKIFTLSANPNLAVGDKVRILYKDGCKELPIILPPTTVAASGIIFVVYQSGGNYYLNSYTSDGVLSAELGILSEVSGNPYTMHVDNNQYVFIFGYDWPDRTIYKYDKYGNFLLSKTIVATEGYMTISPDGYIYTLDSATRNLLRRRNLSDLEINGTVTLTAGHNYYYIAFDSDGKCYLYDISYPFAYVRWILGTGMIGHHSQTNNASSYDSWVIAGDNIGCVASQYAADAYTIAKNMTADRVLWNLDDISTLYRMSSISGYFIALGIDAGGKLIIEKYTSERVRQWKTEVATSFTANLQYCGIGSYPF